LLFAPFRQLNDPQLPLNPPNPEAEGLEAYAGAKPAELAGQIAMEFHPSCGIDNALDGFKPKSARATRVVSAPPGYAGEPETEVVVSPTVERTDRRFQAPRP
jgi:hypothetical protein